MGSYVDAIRIFWRDCRDHGRFLLAFCVVKGAHGGTRSWNIKGSGQRIWNLKYSACCDFRLMSC